MKHDSYFKGCISGVEIIQRLGLDRLKSLILPGDLDLPFALSYFLVCKVFFVVRVRKQTSLIESLAVV